jgi:hypothetical protein
MENKMLNIHKKILTDEAMQPIAVQIDYADWLKIEHLLNEKEESVVTASALERIQEKIKQYIPADRDLADELIAERRHNV